MLFLLLQCKSDCHEQIFPYKLYYLKTQSLKKGIANIQWLPKCSCIVPQILPQTLKPSLPLAFMVFIVFTWYATFMMLAFTYTELMTLSYQFLEDTLCSVHINLHSLLPQLCRGGIRQANPQLTIIYIYILSHQSSLKNCQSITIGHWVIDIIPPKSSKS